MKKQKIIKPNKCKCNFNPPHPFRVGNGKIAVFNGKEYPEEFFCSVCKGLIVNDLNYISEVIKYHAYESAIYTTGYDRNKERAREIKIDWFRDKYKSLV